MCIRDSNEGLIDFDFAADLGTKEIVLHYHSDAMQHEPCGLLSNLHITSNLVAANSVFAVGDEPSCGEPFVERDRRIFHDGTNLDGELALGMVSGASPSAALGAEFNCRRAARRTEHFTVWPASNRQICLLYTSRCV